MSTSAFIHATAVVDRDASLAEGVKVWHFAHVSDGATIGPESTLGQNVFVGRNVRVGARVKVQNNVSIYEGVEIEDDVFLGPSCVFTNVLNPRAFIERRHAFQITRVGRGASIGANATLVCGHSIGAYALVGAGATVTCDVPAHALVVGTPARRVGFVCRCGERLACGPEPKCETCGLRYRIDGERCALLLEEGDVTTLPFFDLSRQHARLAGPLRAAFERVLDSQRYIFGPEVESLERELERELGMPHAITVSSGTDALLVSLMALDIGPGSEVITTPFSFFATAGAIVRLGARPVFVDIDEHTFNLDVQQIEAAIGEKTRAILPVHLFGQCADMTAIMEIAQRRELYVIEDCAQALGATHRGRAAGSFGQLGCFSFFPSKNLGGFGDGGLVVTADARLAERVRVLRAHGADPKYHHRLVGGNFRLDALQAALLRVKLPELRGYLEARREHASAYGRELASVGEAALALPPGEDGHSYNQYVVRTPERDALRAFLAARGVATEIYYPRCLHEQPCFSTLGPMHVSPLSRAERASREVLALPIYPELSTRERAAVIEAVRAFFRQPAEPA